jgi:hypothetical protein
VDIVKKTQSLVAPLVYKNIPIDPCLPDHGLSAGESPVAVVVNEHIARAGQEIGRAHV